MVNNIKKMINGQRVSLCYNPQDEVMGSHLKKSVISKTVRDASKTLRCNYALSFIDESSAKRELYYLFSKEKALSFSVQIEDWYRHLSEEGKASIADDSVIAIILDDSVYFTDFTEGLCVPGGEKILASTAAIDNFSAFDSAAKPVYIFSLSENHFQLPESVSVSKKACPVDLKNSSAQFTYIPLLFVKQRLYHPLYLVWSVVVLSLILVPSYAYIEHRESLAVALAEQQRLSRLQGVKDAAEQQKIKVATAGNFALTTEEQLKGYIHMYSLAHGMLDLGLSTMILNREAFSVDYFGSVDSLFYSFLDIKDYADQNNLVLQLLDGKVWQLTYFYKDVERVVDSVVYAEDSVYPEMMTIIRSTRGVEDVVFSLPTKNSYGFSFTLFYPDPSRIENFLMRFVGKPYLLESFGCNFDDYLPVTCFFSLSLYYGDK